MIFELRLTRGKRIPTRPAHLRSCRTSFIATESTQMAEQLDTVLSRIRSDISGKKWTCKTEYGIRVTGSAPGPNGTECETCEHTGHITITIKAEPFAESAKAAVDNE